MTNSSTSNIDDSLSWLFIRASMRSKQRLMKVAEKHDLTVMQVLTLCSLKPDQPVPMSSISGTFACDPSNVTGIVERLSVGKLIERRESSTDRRVKTITLTDSGEKLRNEIMPEITENDTLILNTLTTAEVAILKELLIKTLPTAKK